MSPFGMIYIDAYDSFSNNIIALLERFATVLVVKIDDEIADLEGLLTQCATVVIGPGPGHPENLQDIGLIPSVLSAATKLKVPVLGVCLGFQVLCSRSGLQVTRHKIPSHGRMKAVVHNGQGIFRDVGMVMATCYNSLGVSVIEIDKDATWSRPGSAASSGSNSTNTPSTSSGPSEARPSDLILQAHDGLGFVMAVKNRTLPQWGLQFHPESCKSSPACYDILKNWWSLVLDWNARRQRCQETWQQSIIAHKYLSCKDLSTTNQTGKYSKHHALIQLLSLTTAVGSEINSIGLKGEVSAEDLSTACYTTWPDRNTVMLESMKKGRFSIFALNSPSAFTLQHRNGVLYASRDGVQVAAWSLTAQDCLYVVEKLVSHRKISACRNGGDHCVSLPFWGGFLGFISYEYGLNLIDVDQSQGRPQPTLIPGLALLWADRSIIVDHVDHTTAVQSIRRDDHEWITATANSIQSGDFKRTEKPGHAARFEQALQNARYSHPDELDYKSRIGKCLRQLRAGNSYELCLTTEAQVRVKATKDRSFQLYQNLRRENPAPFAAYVSLGGTVIISSSPEQFVTWDRLGGINMIPMKGTVRKTPTMTFVEAADILSSPKEQAENLMITDLICHDLHAALGSQATVTVEKLCAVEEYETVYQLVSHIRAEVPLPVTLSATGRQDGVIRYGHAALRHALPPGSMTGAPKKRSCELLSELEKRERGAYSGVIGYFDVGGGGSWSVCIRSAFTNASEDADGMQTWRLGAGGAITVLSDPQAEWEEMQTKLQSVMKAFEPANKPEY